MTREQDHRKNGAIGALLDEYEKALNELKFTIEGLSRDQLHEIVDADAIDEDCKSIQSILTHVVQSGYTYSVEIRKWLGEEVDYRDKETLSSVHAYKAALDTMFDFADQLFAKHPDIKLNEYDLDKKMKVRWGQSFDVEQLMQHAIVHVLRHRRQIEKFKQEREKTSR